MTEQMKSSLSGADMSRSTNKESAPEASDI